MLLEGGNLAARNANNEPVCIWRAREVGGLLALHARYRQKRFPRHAHDHYVVGFDEAGAHSFYCRGEVHSLGRGFIALINPGEVHTGQALGDEWHYRALYPTTALFRQLWEEALDESFPDGVYFPQPVVEDPGLAARLLKASRLSEKGEDELATSTALVEALTALVTRVAARRTALPSANARSSAHRARDYIREHALEPVSLATLAEVAGMGRFGLVRAFRREFAMAPYEYVIALRISRACRMLKQGKALTTVALACGFSDQSHLNRHFRRLIGVAPGAYARAFN